MVITIYTPTGRIQADLMVSNLFPYLVSPDFLIFVNLDDINWYYLAVLLWISQVANIV